MFDPENFMNSVTVDSPLSTITVPIPEGDYRAMVKEVKLEPPGVNKKTGEETSPILRVTWKLLDQDALAAEMEREELLIRQDIWIDRDDNGNFALGKGRNVGLGRLREALGVNNQPGNPFKNLDGGVALIKVAHRTDPDNSEQKYAEVRRVAALPA